MRGRLVDQCPTKFYTSTGEISLSPSTAGFRWWTRGPAVVAQAFCNKQHHRFRISAAPAYSIKPTPENTDRAGQTEIVPSRSPASRLSCASASVRRRDVHVRSATHHPSCKKCITEDIHSRRSGSLGLTRLIHIFCLFAASVRIDAVHRQH